tara:strand:- start:1939 stop:2694 length:756 start_codon:yes stop_codon:yes gene_type:complete
MKKIKDSNEEYHSHHSISASGLKTIYKKSIYHHLNSVFKMTDAMNFGSAVHSALLEDSNDIAVLPEFNARTKEGKKIKKDFFNDNKGKIIIKKEENEAIKKIKDNLNNHSLAKNLIKRLSETEVSYYGTIDDIQVRLRPDGIKDNDYIIDIKTTTDASPRYFKSQIYNFAYHLQATFYSECLGFEPSKFRFITIENKYPYSIEVFAMSEDMINYGKNAWRIAFKSWKEYLETNNIGSFYWEEFNKDGSLIL